MIKRGDLVMVVRGQLCCGGSGASIGKVIVAQEGTVSHPFVQCAHCKIISVNLTVLSVSPTRCYDIRRLKKIDPPSEGETREAYVNLKKPIKQPIKQPKKETV